MRSAAPQPAVTDGISSEPAKSEGTPHGKSEEAIVPMMATDDITPPMGRASASATPEDGGK